MHRFHLLKALLCRGPGCDLQQHSLMSGSLSAAQPSLITRQLLGKP